MASLDDLKKRIASVKSTQKITKAMKMVAAAKLRRAQESAEKGRPYSEKMNNVILNLSNGSENNFTASINSKTLFINVAESIVRADKSIDLPILTLGPWDPSAETNTLTVLSRDMLSKTPSTPPEELSENCANKETPLNLTDVISFN